MIRPVYRKKSYGLKRVQNVIKVYWFTMLSVFLMLRIGRYGSDSYQGSGPSCSKLTISLINVSLNFLSLNTAYRLIFLLKKKCE